MKDYEIMYKAFLLVHKVLGETHPDMSNEERFIRAIVATSEDKWQKAMRINQGKIDQYRGKCTKTLFSDALTRAM